MVDNIWEQPGSARFIWHPGTRQAEFPQRAKQDHGDTDKKPGWYSRGYLPHFDIPDKVQFITLRLHDSLPQTKLDQMEEELQSVPKEKQDVERRRRLEGWLDAGYGECYLQDPRVAKIVENELLAGDGDSYLLLNWTIMPNHVHLLAEFADTTLMREQIKTWKGRTGRFCNLQLERSGQFWYREAYDRYIRDEAHLKNAIRYLDKNPVKAGLCVRPEDWLFGSARRGM